MRGCSRRLLGAVDGVEILNDVVLNQVLVRFGDDDEATRDDRAARPGGRHVLALGHDLAGPRGDADLRLQLAHDARGRRALGRGDSPLRAGGRPDLAMRPARALARPRVADRVSAS